MIRTRCTYTNESGVQCKKRSRARQAQTVCRECFKIRHGKSRPIESRIEVKHGYRRVRARRRVKVVKDESSKKGKK